MRFLVAGGRGYIGSVFVTHLVENGHEAVVVDNRLLSEIRVPGDTVTYVDGDIRDMREWESLLDGVDAVVNLAAIVGDPACDLDPDLAWETNYIGTVRLAEACRRHRVRRMVFASTCSNYGRSGQGEVDIGSALHPQSVYAMTKIHAEHYLLSIADGEFSPSVLRLATVYGLGPRMRFDLAINLMTARAVTEGRITVFNGDQWRPFLHVRDAARAIGRAAASGRYSTVPGVLNCGSNDQNFRMREIGELINNAVPHATLHVERNDDERNYRVNFSRIHAELGFSPRFTVADGIREVRDAVQAGSYPDHTSFEFSNHAVLAARLSRPGHEVPRHYDHVWPQMVFAGTD